MSTYSTITTLSTLIATLSTSAALAAGSVTASGRSGELPYRSGGIGESSQQAMVDARKDFSLSLNFARKDGAYIKDVDLEILNASGQTVLSREDQLPMVLVDLPAGRYTVVSTYQGRTQRHQVEVPNTGNRHVVLTW